MITYSAPASFNMPALISPVNAPSRSKYTFWAAIPRCVFRAASAAAAMDVNGGASTISTLSKVLTSALNSRTYATLSRDVLNIFQLAASRGIRMKGTLQVRS